MSGLRVTPAQLETLSGAVARTSGDIRAQQHGLRTQLGPLFGTDWAGAASAQFASLFEQFDAHARGMCDALDGIGALLGRAGAAYAEVEQQITATFR